MKISTRSGDIYIELYKDTPLHRANFIYLVKGDYFSDTFFHRVVLNFIIQGDNSDLPSTNKKRSDIGATYLLPAEINGKDIFKEGSLIDFDKNFNELLNNLFISYKTDQVKIITRNLLIINWKSKAEFKKYTIYRVLQVLMTNMRKHSKASLVVVASKEDNNKIIINYSEMVLVLI